MLTLSMTTEYMKLQDALKLSRLVSSGGEAKLRIQGGEVAVNGEVCLQRGKKLRPGDTVRFQNQDVNFVYAS
jgi:ribosome-associated protein